MKLLAIVVLACMCIIGAGAAYAFETDVWKNMAPDYQWGQTLLPQQVMLGWIVLREDPLLGNDTSNWADIVQFAQDGDDYYIRLWGTGFSDWSLKVQEAQMGNPLFIDKTGDPTVYTTTGNVYRIWTDTPVPEPGSLLALGSGVLALAGSIMRRRR